MMAIKKGIKPEGCEMIVERPDETRRHVMVYPSPNFNSDGQVVGATNTMIDITECTKANLEALMLVDRLQLKKQGAQSVWLYVVSQPARPNCPYFRIGEHI